MSVIGAHTGATQRLPSFALQHLSPQVTLTIAAVASWLAWGWLCPLTPPHPILLLEIASSSLLHSRAACCLPGRSAQGSTPRRRSARLQRIAVRPRPLHRRRWGRLQRGHRLRERDHVRRLPVPSGAGAKCVLQVGQGTESTSGTPCKLWCRGPMLVPGGAGHCLGDGVDIKGTACALWCRGQVLTLRGDVEVGRREWNGSSAQCRITL